MKPGTKRRAREASEGSTLEDQIRSKEAAVLALRKEIRSEYLQTHWKKRTKLERKAKAEEIELAKMKRRRDELLAKMI